MKVSGNMYTPMLRPPQSMMQDYHNTKQAVNAIEHFAPVKLSDDNLAMSNMTRQFFTEGLQELLQFDQDIPVVDEDEGVMGVENDLLKTVQVIPNP